MPVIADSDEPPAKCCKFCDETKCHVDGGPNSWRLTLDQDLIDTLKESFPDWFQQIEQIKPPNQEPKVEIGTVDNSNSSATKLAHNSYKFDNNNIVQAATIDDNLNNYAKSSKSIFNCATCELIDKNINCTTKRSTKEQSKESNINNGSISQHLNQLNGNKPSLTLTTNILSKSLPPASSINFGCTLNAKKFLPTKKKQTNKRYCSIKSVLSSNNDAKVNNLHTFLSSNCSVSSESASSNIPSPTSYPSSSPFSLSQSPILNLKAFHNDSSFLLLSESIAITTAAATTTTITNTTTTTTAASTVINSNSTIISKTSITTAPKLSFPSLTGEHCRATSDPLLATFSDSVTFEILSDSCSYNRLLTTSTSSTSTSVSHSFVHNLLIKTPVEHSCKDNILLQEIHTSKNDMSEEEQKHLNAPSLTGQDGTNSDVYDPRQSPPKAFVDSSPLQPAMDKNKESLKVKLMVRRPHSQLVEQGIIPPLKTSPAIHEQCKQLERAKTSDLLKAKIQQRPNREDLERRHILEEDECHIDPSLAEKQRMLKKARLADQLNSQIQHRPGPLELIKKNILHTEKPIEKIVKEGLVTFKATSEGLLTRPQHPNSYVTFEEESLSSESDSLRQTPSRGNEFVSGCAGVCSNSDVTATTEVVTIPVSVLTTSDSALPKSPTVETPANLEESKRNYGSHQIASSSLPPFKVTQETANLYEELCQSVTGSGDNYLSMISSLPSTSFGSVASAFSPVPSVASSTLSNSGNLTTSTVSPSGIQIAKSDAPGKDKNRKKSKSKPLSKARTIKFHEYKGPPSASNKNSMDTSLTTEETSYQLMLEQQNCLLKFLETLNKNQSILPAANTSPNTLVSNVTAISTVGKSGTNVANTVITATATCNDTLNQTPTSNTCTPMQGIANESGLHSNNHAPIVLSSLNNNNFTSRPSITTSPALSTTSIPLSPGTNYPTPIIDVSKLEKMKVSDLKVHLKKRNLPVSGSKSQLIERLRSYLTLEPSDNTALNVTQCILNKEAEKDTNMEPMDTNTSTTSTGSSYGHMEPEQMNVSPQLHSPRSSVLPNVMQTSQPDTTIILSNEELLKEQQRKIDELQRQLQKSQQELQEIRQKQRQNNINQKFHPQTLPNGLSTQQITFIATTKPSQASHTVAVLHPQINETFVPARITLKAASTVKTVIIPSSGNDKKDNTTNGSLIVKQSNNTTMMSQKMVVKQQLEAKIQKQAAAAAAKAQAQAQMMHSQRKHIYQLHQETQTPKTQTHSVLIPTTTGSTTTISKTNEKIITTKGLTHNVIVAPNQNQLPLTRANNNLGLVWNEGNQTIFLVGLNDQHMTAHTIGNINLGTSESNKRFSNNHPYTNSVANVTFSIPSESTYNQFNTQYVVTRPAQEQTTIIQAKHFPISQQIQKRQQKHAKKIQTQFNHLVEQQQRLDITTTSPSKYNEDTKHLQNNIDYDEQKTSTILNPLIKIKEEILSPTADIPNEQERQRRLEYQPSVIDSPIIKSEKLTDVLDILVKQGDLPESALVPMAPTNKLLLSSDKKKLMNDLDNDTEEEQNPFTSRNYMNKIHRMSMESNNEISRKISPTQSQSQSQTEEFNSFYQSLNTPPVVTFTNSNNFNSNHMQNNNVTPTKSFLQSSLNAIPTNANKSFDMFLDDAHQISRDGSGAQRNNDNSSVSCGDDLNLTNKEIKKIDLSSTSSITTATPKFPVISHSDYQQHNQNVADGIDHLDHLSDNDTKLNHFDEFELLELMSQQLEMDIGEASDLAPHAIPIGKPNNVNQITSQFHHSNIKLNSGGSCNVNMNGFRRSMNPSMQPSLTEFMQNHISVANVDNPSSCRQLNNNNNVNEKFHTENLNQFDNVALIESDHVSPPTLSSQNSQQEEQQANNLINNSHFLPIQMNPTNSIIPMDVCDDFDNTLNDFNFSSSTTNIDSLRQTTPTFDQFELNSTSENIVSSSTSTATPTTRYGVILQDSNSSTTTTAHYIHPSHEEMSICSTSLSENGITSHNDTFCSPSSDIFDLFNMDDYKMAWSEGDFVV